MQGGNPMGFGPGAPGYGNYTYGGEAMLSRADLEKLAKKSYTAKYGPKVRVLSTD